MRVSAADSVQNKHEKSGPNVLGALGALAVTHVPSLVSPPVSIFGSGAMRKINRSLTKDQVDIINQGSEKVLNEITNLKTKGVRICNYSSKNSYGSLTKLSKLPESVINLISPMDAIANGANACYEPIFNKIMLNKEKLSTSVFHELGHAFNFHNSNFWRGMQRSRMLFPAIAGLIAIIPAITKEAKAEDGKELTEWQKVKNFIRNAAPVAATVPMLGIVAEETMATIRGNRWAKQVLDPTLAKKVSRGNAIGLVSYLLVAGAFGLGSYMAKKVKDSSDEKRANKLKQQ